MDSSVSRGQEWAVAGARHTHVYDGNATGDGSMTHREGKARAARIALGAFVACGAAVVRTLTAFRASEEARRHVLPGDVIVPDPMYVTTQAVVIPAAPRAVWPWLVQMGSGRAGWYSYGRIDNGGRASAEAILPELQHVVPGDIFPAVPGATDAFVVAVAEPQRDLILTVPANGATRVSWEFFLEPLDHDRTRLTVRSRLSRDWLTSARGAPAGRPIFIERVYALLARLPLPLLCAVGGFGHRVMQNQQLRGIRRRASGAVGTGPTTARRSPDTRRAPLTVP